MPKLVPGVDYWWDVALKAVMRQPKGSPGLLVEPLMWYNPPKRVRELALQHPRPSTPVT